MARLSAADIAKYATVARFLGDDRVIAVSVALAESGGDPQAHNATPPDDSYGLWQINMLGNLGPARRRQFGISSNEALYDPQTNARAAKAIRDASGWGAWTTYTSGAYRQHTLTAQQGIQAYVSGVVDATGEAVDGMLGDTPLDPLLDVAGAIADATRYLDAAGQWLGDRQNWIRIAQFVVGATTIVAGAVLIARPLVTSAAGAAVGGVVKGALKGVGKATK